MTRILASIRAALRARSDPAKKEILQRFFKTGPGEYGAGDVFLGVVVPDMRTVARGFRHASSEDIDVLLRSRIHEERLTALLILVEQYKDADVPRRKRIIAFYLERTSRVDNWDLVDLSADKLLGDWLLDKDTNILDRLARSKSIWERRIAIVATFAFIRRGRFGETLRIAEILLDDQHDLIHKATGWMLREVGKRDERVLRRFLDHHRPRMPRTMLRYAIERFPEKDRLRYLRRV